MNNSEKFAEVFGEKTKKSAHRGDEVGRADHDRCFALADVGIHQGTQGSTQEEGQKEEGDRSMNSIHIMGRLVKDPEVSSSTSGTTYARYTVAVDRKYKKEGQQSADFFPCVSFGKQAEFVEKYLKKGTKVVITGEMALDTVKKDGQTSTYPKVMVSEIEFAESKQNNETKDVTDIAVPEELPFS